MANNVQFDANQDLTWLVKRIDFLLFQPLSFAVEPLQGMSISPAMKAKLVQLFNSMGFEAEEHDEVLNRIQCAAKHLRAMWQAKDAGTFQEPGDSGFSWKQVHDTENGNPGLSKETIAEKLVSGRFSSANPNEEESCCICLAAYLEGERTGELRCLHKFHWECAGEWLKEVNQCPVCRQIGLDVGPAAGPAQE